ncbi:MAG TPA: glycosyltransferase family 4 protein [Hyphomicrobiaceae bacterium]|nr:glycosyltransferase family 4 protein [Hyphomicrobiaceae bacterium]
MTPTCQGAWSARPTPPPASRLDAAAEELRIVFMYLGRGGALGNFAQSLAGSASLAGGVAASFVVSQMNPCLEALRREGATLAVPTFEPGSAIAPATNFLAAKRKLHAHLCAFRPHAVVNLMPHVWTPLWVPAIRKAGISFVSIVHDAVPHPGDATGRLLWWLHREARAADLVVTLSRHVAAQLHELGVAPAHRTAKLFLPDFVYGPPGRARSRRDGRPLRLLFFGRILAYKGLPVLLDAVEQLREQGVTVELGVAGVGDLRPYRARIEALGGEIINRWIEDREVGPLLARYDAMALPYVECSQSAAAATALGAGMPLVGMPVGGLSEQIVDGVNGVLAHAATAKGLAGAIRRLATDNALHARLCAGLRATMPGRSADLFLSMLVGEVARLRTGRRGAHLQARSPLARSKPATYAVAE